MDETQRREGSQAEGLPEPRRRKRWPTVVAVLIVLVAIAGIVVWDRTIGKLRAMKSTWPYKTALALIQKEPKAIEVLGEPIRDASFIPAGSVPTKKNPGAATLSFKVSGPKGKADVAVMARLDQGTWAMPKLELTLPGQKPISVDTSSLGGSAPKFAPGSGLGGVEPPKPRLPDLPPFKPGPGTSKEPTAAGPNIKVEIPDLDLK